MTIENSTGEMIELGAALEQTSGRLRDMTSAFGSLSKSSTEWTIISRVLSGSPLWKLQNRVRALGNVFFILEERAKKNTEAQQEYFKTMAGNQKSLQSMQLTLHGLGAAEDSRTKKRVKDLDSYKSFVTLYGKELGEMKLKEKYETSLEKAKLNRFRLSRMGHKDRMKGYKEELEVNKKRMKVGILWHSQTAANTSTKKPGKRRRPSPGGIGAKIEEIISQEEIKAIKEKGEELSNALSSQSLTDVMSGASGLQGFGLDTNKPRSQAQTPLQMMEALQERQGPQKKERKRLKRKKSPKAPLGLGNITLSPETMKHLQAEKKVKDLGKLLSMTKKAGIFGAKTYETLHAQQKSFENQIKDDEEKFRTLEKYDTAAAQMKDAEMAYDVAKSGDDAKLRADANEARLNQQEILEEIKAQMTNEGLKIYGLEDQKMLLKESIELSKADQKESNEYLERMEEAINEFPDSFSEFKESFEGMTKFEGLKNMFSPFNKQIKFIKIWLDKSKIGKRMKKMWKDGKAMAAVAGKFLLYASLIGLLLLVLWRFGVFESIADFFTKTIPKWWKSMNEAWGFLDMIKEGASEIWVAIKDLFNKDKPFWGSLLKLGLGILKLLGGLIILAIASIFILLLPILEPFFRFLGGVFKFVEHLLDSNWGEAKKVFKAGLKTIGGFFGKILLGIGAAMMVIAAAADWKSWIVAYAAATIATGIILSLAGGMAKGGLVNKTGSWLVGEQGPEIVSLPKGATVHNNADSRKMMGNNITINVQGRVGSSETELRDIARKVGRLVSQEINRTTSSSTIYR